MRRSRSLSFKKDRESKLKNIMTQEKPRERVQYEEEKKPSKYEKKEERKEKTVSKFYSKQKDVSDDEEEKKPSKYETKDERKEKSVSKYSKQQDSDDEEDHIKFEEDSDDEDLPVKVSSKYVKKESEQKSSDKRREEDKDEDDHSDDEEEYVEKKSSKKQESTIKKNKKVEKFEKVEKEENENDDDEEERTGSKKRNTFIVSKSVLTRIVQQANIDGASADIYPYIITEMQSFVKEVIRVLGEDSDEDELVVKDSYLRFLGDKSKATGVLDLKSFEKLYGTTISDLKISPEFSSEAFKSLCKHTEIHIVDFLKKARDVIGHYGRKRVCVKDLELLKKMLE